MTFGAEIWGPPLIAAGASWLSGQGNAKKETKMEKTKRKLVDQLLASLQGSGPYSDLYDADQETFKKSFIEPAQSKFRNEIAPQIQQQFIASGQQRGTGLDDTLTRAGVDLDSLLNQHMYKFQQDALNRKQNSLNAILGLGAGAQNTPTGTQDIMSGLSGYLNSDTFSNQFAGFFDDKNPAPQSNTPTPPTRPGYKPDWLDYNQGSATGGY